MLVVKAIDRAASALVIVGLLGGLVGCKRAVDATEVVNAKRTISAVASADIQLTGLELHDTFEQWMKQYRIAGGALAISHRGDPVLQHGIRRSADKAYPVASLSKVITAVCLQQLLDQQGKTVDLPLQQVIPTALDTNPPADPRLAEVTLAQLVSHNSGIQSRYHRQFIANKQIYDQQRLGEQYRALAAETLSAQPGSGYHYSNANYMLLGLAIEEMSGQAYDDYCSSQVLQPAGVSAQLNPRWRVMSAWGGWQISAVDFLKFLNTYFADNKVLGRDPATLRVNTPVGRGAYYGLGTLTRPANQGHRFWHSGAWGWSDNNRDDRFGAYYIIREDGLMIVMNYAEFVHDKKLRDLENRLVKVLNL
jgi:CubicO group peptidase (beta-lactamase class C family)